MMWISGARTPAVGAAPAVWLADSKEGADANGKVGLGLGSVCVLSDALSTLSLSMP